MIMKRIIIGDANKYVGVVIKRRLVFTNRKFQFINLWATMTVNAVVVYHSTILIVFVTVNPR